MGKAFSYREVFKIFKEVLKDKFIRNDVAILKKSGLKTFIWIIVAEVVITFQPYPFKWFFDGLVNHWDKNLMYLICALIFIIHFLGTRIHRKMDVCRNAFVWKMWATLWSYSHWREQKLSADWHVKHSTGEKESLVGKNIGEVERLVDESFFRTLPMTFRILFAAIMVWFLGIHFGTVAAITIVWIVFLLAKTEKVMEPFRRETRQQIKKIEQDGSELTKNWRTLKQFGIEDNECLEHKKLLDDFCVKEKPRFEIFLKCYSRQEDVISVSKALVFGSILYFLEPNLSVGSIVLATAWMERIYSNLYRYYNFQRALNEGKEALRELCEIFSIIPSVRQPEIPKLPKEGIQGRVEFRNVNFQFPEKSECTLKDINLTIEPFQCIALVGRSGAGKTTFSSLLIREFDPTSGDVLVDGVNLKEIDYDRYRKEAIAVVSQKIDLFDGTVTENIRKANQSATFDEVMEASKKAYAHEFIEKLDHGYESMIGEDGIQLSGGQRQRLAIARALVRKPKILILDEATSSLDGESQAEVQKAIQDLIKNREATIFIIAHRLSTIKHADLIVVLEEGGVGEVGTHYELMKKDGLYRKFVDREIRDFLDEYAEFMRPA